MTSLRFAVVQDLDAQGGVAGRRFALDAFEMLTVRNGRFAVLGE